MNFPLVSVIIPAYNAANYLQESVNSIFEQTYKNIEIILVDDGSTDNTSKLCEIWVKSNPKFKYYRQKNSGIVSALNFGIQISTGSIIARMDADDISLPTRIEKQVKYLYDHDVALVSCAYISFNDENDYLMENYHPTSYSILLLLLCYCSPICHPGVMVRRDIIQNLLYTKNVIAEDHLLWCEIALHNKISNINELLIKYRRHRNSLSSKNQRNIRYCMLKNGFIFFTKNYTNIAKLNFNELFINKIEFSNIRWLPAFLYLFLAKCLMLIKCLTNKS